jgi:hypothetical protein
MACATFSITLRDHTTESIDGADTYVHEKVMTTFYRTDNARGAVDCWSTAMASFRTDEILAIRRLEAEAATSEEGFPALSAVS